MMFRDKKEEFQGELGMFTNLNKTMVIQDAQAFNDSPLNYRKCRQILTKLLYLIYQSETLTSKEATNVFFAATKSFQCKDSALRRLTYLVIKELSGTAEDVIMVTSSLTQDINSKDADIALFKANAIRVLGLVIDASMLTAVERFMKQAIVDRDHGMASSAILTGYHFFGQNKDVIKRWVAEIQQALNAAASKSITQYHALGLLYLLKQGDRMALSKLVQQVSKSSSNPLAICLFLKIYAQLLVADPNIAMSPIDLKPYLRQSGPRGEMVGLEAARIICDRAADVYTNDVVYAITALQMFLGSPKPVVRFAALRILNDLAGKCPQKVAQCNQDIESLITNPNRNIATLAITALLKTGDENAVDRLVKQIRSYVGEISDEFKIIVVDAVRTLCLKFPNKYQGMLDFLGSVLRDEGAYDYKQACVDAICQIIEAIPEAAEGALVHLCEFIEDSEYPNLTVQILHLLGSLGPSTKHPSKMIRYIYNRLVLEDATVRVAAVGALTKFAIEQPTLKSGIVSILKRCQNDPDDDVRDRARLSLKGMETAPQYFSDNLVPDLEALEKRLLEYTSSLESFKEPFSLAGLPTLTEGELFNQAKKARFEQLVPSAASPTSGSFEQLEESVVVIDAIPITEVGPFSAFGPVLKSSASVPLTESGTEYGVAVRKHIFERKAVLEFICSNTVPGLLLSNVSVSVGVQGPLRQETVIPIEKLAHNETASCYVSFDKPSGVIEAAIECTLCFLSQECDPDTNAPLEAGYTDKYPIDPVEFGLGDFLKARAVYDWEADWSGLGEEAIQTFALESIPTLPEAVSAIMGVYGLPGIAGSAVVDPGSPVHTLMMCGCTLEQSKFAVRCRMALTRGAPGVSLELAVRADDAATTAIIVNALG